MRSGHADERRVGNAGRLLLETDLSPEQRTYAEAITQSGEALLALIGDILDFSKIESGTLTLEEDEVELRALLCGVAELLAPRAHAKGIEIALVVDGNVPDAIRTDEVRFRQVITNLLGNAVKFTEKGGVCVSVSVANGLGGGELRVEVCDTGVGVPDAKQREIFQEFVQADSSHARKFGGSGLGLAISKRLVEAMGGQIGMQSGRDGGSVFWFTVPALSFSDTSEHQKVLAGKRVAIVSRNKILVQGLTAQLEQAGVTAINFSHLPPGGRIDAVLVDAGTDGEPGPAIDPVTDVPTLVLVTPAARGKAGRADDPRLCRLSGQAGARKLAAGMPGILHGPARQGRTDGRAANPANRRDGPNSDNRTAA